ncbi:serine protease [Flavobacterium sp. LS1R10]|uniref:S1 family peptidase n=1 Tax=Flavobacterium sp. LS1R10 TaxID=2497482 RepID=UPI000F82E579|nr:serine protease [Flavobacterium sp. LS1R10]RTY76531.1 serine protease [Flavobacterium sp. LS1R10]
MRKNVLLIIVLIISTNYIISQENKLSPSELIINSTIRIECTGDTIINNQKTTFTSTGTGFFFEFLIDNIKIPVIVTNYHVIKNTTNGILNFTEQENGLPKYGSILTYTLNDFQNRWIKHPNVDLAILPIAGIIDDFKKQKNKDILYVPYDETLLPNAKLLNEITAIEKVLMIGYPKGFWDKVNNLPVVRKGLTATPLYINYSGKKEFLLDIPIFAGSSGSPIVLFNHGSYSTKLGEINIGSRIALLGMRIKG